MALAVPLGLLALWELLARLAVVSPRYFPPPTRTASVLAGSFSEGELGGETLITLGRLAAAFALAAVPAVPLGLLMGLVKPVRTAVEPYIAFLPSEFLRFRLGYKHTDRTQDAGFSTTHSARRADEFFFQATFVLGLQVSGRSG